MKVACNRNKYFRSLTLYENSLMFTGDHSIKVFSPVTRECTPYLAHGKGTREGSSAQPARRVMERRTVSGIQKMGVTDFVSEIKRVEN